MCGKFQWKGLSIESYKIECKKLFLLTKDWPQQYVQLILSMYKTLPMSQIYNECFKYSEI